MVSVQALPSPIYYLTILDNFPLLKSDRMLLERFRRDPDGRGFLSVVELLKACNFPSESLELLQSGVAAHPRFSAARVVLAKEFFQRGMIYEALSIIEESPVNLKTNIMAQKIKLKALLLLQREQEFCAVLDFLNAERALDDECKQLAQLFHRDGFAKTAAIFAARLVADGVPVNTTLPSSSPPTPPPPHPPQETSNYWIMPVDEIFFRNDNEPRGNATDLETQAMAQVYEDQGNHAKALQIYRRLLAKLPHNEFLRHKVIELAQLVKKPKHHHLVLDAATISRIERLDQIDLKLKKCRTFLQRLA